jgi:hypothetical protein
MHLLLELLTRSFTQLRGRVPEIQDVPTTIEGLMWVVEPADPGLELLALTFAWLCTLGGALGGCGAVHALREAHDLLCAHDLLLNATEQSQAALLRSASPAITAAGTVDTAENHFAGLQWPPPPHEQQYAEGGGEGGLWSWCCAGPQRCVCSAALACATVAMEAAMFDGSALRVLGAAMALGCVGRCISCAPQCVVSAWISLCSSHVCVAKLRTHRARAIHHGGLRGGLDMLCVGCGFWSLRRADESFQALLDALEEIDLRSAGGGHVEGYTSVGEVLIGEEEGTLLEGGGGGGGDDDDDDDDNDNGGGGDDNSSGGDDDGDYYDAAEAEAALQASNVAQLQAGFGLGMLLALPGVSAGYLCLGWGCTLLLTIVSGKVAGWALLQHLLGGSGLDAANKA